MSAAPTPDRAVAGGIGFGILAHRNPDQVHRLADVLVRYCPGATVVIHWDASAPGPIGAPTDERVTVVDRPVSVEWGTWSQIDATVRCLRSLVSQTPSPSWYVLLSGQDYPCRPLAGFASLLASAATDGWLGASPVDLARADQGDAAQRYTFRWRQLPERPPVSWLPQRTETWLERRSMPVRLRLGSPSGSWLGLSSRRHPFGSTVLYKGTQWFTLARAAVLVLLGAYDHSNLTRWFRRSLIPDESWPHTVLYNTPGIRLRPDDQRYVRFRAGSQHPDTLGEADLPAIQASGRFFARKFDEGGTSPLLDRLDALAADRDAS